MVLRCAECALEIDGVAPPAPPDVVASPTGEKAVLVKWTAIPEEVLGYRVYRATSEDGLAAGRIADALKETRLADPVTEERVYFYAVSAVDLAGNESPLSRHVRVLADVTASGPPDLSAPSVDSSVTVRLQWKSPTGAEQAGCSRGSESAARPASPPRTETAHCRWRNECGATTGTPTNEPRGSPRKGRSAMTGGTMIDLHRTSRTPGNDSPCGRSWR